jgi:hypothetical protein
LIDLFVVDAGIIVVDASSVALIGRDAKVIKAVPFARQITAAAFDGTTLVVADAAELTVMSPALDVGPTAFLIDGCGSAVLVGGNYFVCGPNTDVSRVYDTYDVRMNPPTRIASSSPYTYDGVPMRPVPGTNHFVTVTLNISPPSFSLFQLAFRRVRRDAGHGVRRYAGHAHDSKPGRHPGAHGERLPEPDAVHLRLLHADRRARNAAHRAVLPRAW